MVGKRTLPLVVEQSLAEIRYLQTRLETDFKREIQKTSLEQNTNISCKVGCSNCCYHPVYISAIEGAVIYRQLSSKGQWTPAVQAKLQEHADKTQDLSFEVWFLSVLACPLLDEKTRKCTVYTTRPYVCRATFSTGNPDKCHPHRIAESGIVNKRDTMYEFYKEQGQIAKRHKLQMVLMTLSAAVLIGKKIVSGEISLEDADREILRQVQVGAIPKKLNP